jgi:hypothetical protein
VTIDNLVPFIIVAVVVISSIASSLRTLKRAAGGAQRSAPAQTAAPVPQVSGPQVTGPRLSESQIERVHAIEAQLARRGITPPPGLQAVMNAFEAAAAPPPPPPVQPAAAQLQQSHRHRHQAPAAAPGVPLRQTVPIARSIDVAAAGVPVAADLDAAPAVSGTRRMLAAAFGDPAHARNAVVLSEVLGPPVALR